MFQLTSDFDITKYFGEVGGYCLHEFSAF